MNSIQQTIREYSEGCRRLSGRIVELSEEIGHAYRQGGEHKNLVERRYLLYSELAEMQGALRELREYLAQLGEESPEEPDADWEVIPVSVFVGEGGM